MSPRISALYAIPVLGLAVHVVGCIAPPPVGTVATVTEFGQCDVDGVVVQTGDPHPNEDCQVCGAALEFVPCLFGCDPDGLCRTPTALAAGDRHTCALVGDGDVYCWGENLKGQTGNGALGEAVTAVTRVELPLGAQAAQLAASDEQTCVLTHAGQVFCWGGIDWISGGQLEFCDPIDKPTGVPTLITCIDGQGPATALRLQGTSMCAINGTGLFCMTRLPPQKLREHVPEGLALTQFELGQQSLCIVTDDGGVHCVGSGAVLGEGNEVVTVDLPGKAASLATGWDHACVRSADGDVWCWGSNALGQLPGIDAGLVVAPTAPVRIDSGVRRVAVGKNHTCVLSGDEASQVRCWGQGPQVGVRDDEGVGRSNFDRVSTMAVGAEHTCVIDERGVIWCWGRNKGGQLGTAFILDTARPGAVLTPNPTEALP